MDIDAPTELPRRDTRGLRMCPWGCGQIVRQTVTLAGKPLCVDPDPVTVDAGDPDPNRSGNVAAYLDALTVWRSRVLRKGDGLVHTERRFMPHIATCPRSPRTRPQQVPIVHISPRLRRVARLDDYRRRRRP